MSQPGCQTCPPLPEWLGITQQKETPSKHRECLHRCGSELLLPGLMSPLQPGSPLGWHLATPAATAAVPLLPFYQRWSCGRPCAAESGFTVKVEGFLKIERKYVGNEKIRLNLMHRNNKRRGLGKYANAIEKKR